MKKISTHHRWDGRTTSRPLSRMAMVLWSGICLVWLSSSLRAQTDAPPPSRYIGPIIAGPTSEHPLDPPASRYVGKIGAEPKGSTGPRPSQPLEQAHIEQPYTEQADNWQTHRETRRNKIVVEVHVPNSRVQQVQHLSEDSNRYFVPPKRVPLQAPRPLVDESTGRAVLPSSRTIEESSAKPTLADTVNTNPSPTRTAQAPPALPEPLEAEALPPVQLPMPEPMPLPVEPKTKPVPAEPKPTPPAEPEVNAEKPVSPRSVQPKPAQPIQPQPPEPSPLVQPPKDPNSSEEEYQEYTESKQSVGVPPAPTADSYPAPATASLPTPMFDMDCGCDFCGAEHCSPMFEQNCFPDLAAFATFTFKGGNHRTLGDGRLFLPLYEDGESVLFADLRGQIDDREAREGNWGLGYREFIDPEWIFGIYAYYDVLRTKNNNTFHQGTVGMELLSEAWDFRINGYFPEMGAKSTSSNAAVVNGNILVNNMAERAHRGFDAEFGRRVLHWGLNDKYEVRWFAGGYHFNNDARGFGSFGGVSTRIEFRAYDLDLFGHQSRLEMGFEGSYDKVREELAYGFVRLRVPLSPGRSRHQLNPIRRRLADLVVRDVDVIARNAVNSSEDAINPLSGKRFGELLQLTADDDYLALIEASNENDLIVMDGSKGEFGLDGFDSIQLKNGQTLLGGGQSIRVTGAQTGNSAWLDTSGTRATVHSNYNSQEFVFAQGSASIPFEPSIVLPIIDYVVPQPVIQVANRTIVSGIDISGGRIGVGGYSVSDVVVNDVTVSDTTGQGIEFSDVSQLVIQKAQVSQSGQAGIAVSNFEDVTIDRVQVDNSHGNGILVNSGKNLMISNSEIEAVQQFDTGILPIFPYTSAPIIDSLSVYPNFVSQTYGMRLSGIENVLVGGNTIRDVNYAISADNVQGVVNIVNNDVTTGLNNNASVFYFPQNIGIYVSTFSGTMNDVVIADNVIDASGISQSLGISVRNGHLMDNNYEAQTRVLNNHIKGLTSTAFQIQSGIEEQNITIANNLFEYSDIREEQLPWAISLHADGNPPVRLFQISMAEGPSDLTLMNNTFQLVGGGVNDRPSEGVITSSAGADLNLTLRNNSMPGEFVTLFRDTESTINLLSNTDNNFQLTHANGSEPISGVDN